MRSSKYIPIVATILAVVVGIVSIAGSGGVAPGIVQVQGRAAAGVSPVGNPVYVGFLTGGTTGGQLTGVTACFNSATVGVTAGNTTEIVAGSATGAIRVCSFSVTMSAAGTARWVSADTGGGCANAVSLTGTTPLATGTPWTVGAGGIGQIFRTTDVSKSLCMVAVTGNVVGVVTYAIY